MSLLKSGTRADEAATERRKAEARAEREAGRRELSRRGVFFGTLISVTAVIGGAVVGAIVTLAIAVLGARFGSYIYSLHDLATIRWETLPVLFGMAGGVTLAILHPRALDRATLLGLLGLALGIVLGIFAGRWLWGAGEGPWAGGIVFGAGGMLVGITLSLAAWRPRRGRRRMLSGGVGSVLLVVIGVFVAVGFTRVVTGQPVDLPQSESAPVPPPEEVASVVFLLGDAGYGVTARSPVFAALAADIERWSAELGRDSAVTLLSLGDIVYPQGVHAPGTGEFPQDSARLWSQIGLLGGDEARRHGAIGVFLAGNHDWGNMFGEQGLERLMNLSEQLEVAREAGFRVALHPPAGSPGPTWLDLEPGVRMVFLDTHWFLQPRPASVREVVYERLEMLLSEAGDRPVVMAAHHPYETAGPHGTIVPGYDETGIALLLRKSGTLVQDLNSGVYAELLAGLRRTFERAGPPLVFAGGHDHSLQVLESAGALPAPRLNLVSGSGSQISGIGDSEGLVWAAVRPGWMMLVLRTDGGVDLFVVAGDPEYVSCEVPEDELEECMARGAASFDIAYSTTILEAPAG